MEVTRGGRTAGFLYELPLPADERLGGAARVVEWHVEPGARVEGGSPLATVAAGEEDGGRLRALAVGRGRVSELRVALGERLVPGESLVQVAARGEDLPEPRAYAGLEPEPA